MSIELDWQIVEQDVPPGEAAHPTPPRQPRRFGWRQWLIAIAVTLALVALGIGGYVAVTYRQQLNQAENAVRLVARQEAQAIAANDRESFLALQDPDDPLWRAAQRRNFGKLEHEGLPEFSWKASGTPPQPGLVKLEPSGAQLEMFYRFDITQPLPNGPTSILINVPQYYKQTPSGWVRAMPVQEFWGRWNQRPGKRVSVIYLYRDGPWVEPLAARLDEMADRLCKSLPCPPLMGLLFENMPDSISNLKSFSYGFDDNITLKLPSPHLIGLPADVPSRDEYHRAIATRIVQALTVEASKRELNMTYLVSQELVRWEIAQAGLSGPFIHDGITRTMRTTPALARQPLWTIPLRSVARGLDVVPGQVVVPLAFDFLERRFGVGTISRMVPSLTSPRALMLGEAINTTLHVNAASLEPEWQQYLREREGTPTTEVSPTGELALWCAPYADDKTGSLIFWTRADGTAIQFPSVGLGSPSAWPPHWSPGGKQLAYAQGNTTSARVMVMDVESRTLKTLADVSGGAPLVGWLPDGRLQIAQDTTHLIDLDTGTQVEITGTRHIWSPDGNQVAYLTTYPTQTIWLADADGRNPRRVALGTEFAWSPNSRRLALLGLLSANRTPDATELQIVDAANRSIRTLTRASNLVRTLTNNTNTNGWLTDIAWSPDSSLLAVALAWSDGSGIVVLDASSGMVRARWRWDWTRTWFPDWTWAASGQYLAVWVTPDSMPQGAVGILDIRNGQQSNVPGKGFGWSPDGQWLAVTQEPSGLLITTPDLTITRWINTPNCFDVTWRPK